MIPPGDNIRDNIEIVTLFVNVIHYIYIQYVIYSMCKIVDNNMVYCWFHLLFLTPPLPLSSSSSSSSLLHLLFLPPPLPLPLSSTSSSSLLLFLSPPLPLSSSSSSSLLLFLRELKDPPVLPDLLEPEEWL